MILRGVVGCSMEVQEVFQVETAENVAIAAVDVAQFEMVGKV